MSLKELKIKTGVVKRLVKEDSAYAKEQTAQQARIDKLIAEKADEHDIRKQKEVLEETVQMIPDTKRRLAAAQAELKQLVAKAMQDATVNESAEFLAAQQVLASAPVA